MLALGIRLIVALVVIVLAIYLLYALWPVLLVGLVLWIIGRMLVRR